MVIFPEAKRRPASPLNSSEGSFIRSPVSAPSHDGSPGMMAKFAAMEAKMAEFAAMQAKMASLAAMEARMEALELENKNLRGKVGGTTSPPIANMSCLYVAVSLTTALPINFLVRVA